MLESFRGGRETWVNHDLESFIAAFAAWTEDCDGYYENRGLTTPADPTWEMLADMFNGARIYE
jgi:hypothetical protein